MTARHQLTLIDCRHLDGAGRGACLMALDRSLAALRDAGTVEVVDQVRVAALRTLARAIDDDARRPDVTAYSLATAVKTLTDLFDRLAPGGAHDDDGFAALMADLSTPTRNQP